MAMDRPGTGAARTAADDAQAQRGLTMEFGRDVPLPLDCGIPLGPFTLAYQTYGTLNAERSNAILVCHALTGDQYLAGRSEEHTSELQSLMRISYAVLCLKKKKYKN